MVPPVVRLLGTAILLDAFLIIVTLPFTKWAMSILVPATIVTGSAAVWTYALVLFTLVLGVLLYLLWMFEGWYRHLFSFWQLISMMLSVLAGYLWWNGGL